MITTKQKYINRIEKKWIEDLSWVDIDLIFLICSSLRLGRKTQSRDISEFIL